MPVIPWLLTIVGAFGLGATHLGWLDAGGPLRRTGWLGFYNVLDQRWAGGNARRAMYTISGAMLLIGVLLLVR